jgi:hypothetical protein
MTLYVLIGMFLSLTNWCAQFLIANKAIELQNWPLDELIVFKLFVWVSLLKLIMCFFQTLVVQIQLILIIYLLLIFGILLAFLCSNFKLKNSLYCFENVPATTQFSKWEMLVGLPFSITMLLYYYDVIQKDLLIFSFFSTIAPLLMYGFIVFNSTINLFYKTGVVFMKNRYTFVFSMGSVVVLLLSISNLSYGVYGTLLVFSNRLIRLVFLYDEYTIKSLHHTFCCASSVYLRKFWQGAAAGGAVATLAKTQAGQAATAFVHEFVEVRRERNELDRGFAINNQQLADQSITKEQHNNFAQQLVQVQVDRAKGSSKRGYTGGGFTSEHKSHNYD